MRFATSVAAGSALICAVAAAPASVPSTLPNPSANQVAQLISGAGGNVPGASPPSSLTSAATTTLQLIAFNEFMESAFFNQLCGNISASASGYTLDGYSPNQVVKSLTTILYQEQLHALGANSILAAAGKTTIQPCQYQFPVSNFQQSIAFANAFTDMVLSVLPLAQVQFAKDGGQELGLVQLLGSIIGQEGEQNGWFRSLLSKTASAAPFLTTSGPQFAFSLLQTVIVPGSCPNMGVLSSAIPTFSPLNVVTQNIPSSDSTVQFSVSGANITSSGNSIAYLSGQNSPITVPISNVQTSNGVTTFSASLPFSSGKFANGLTVAAVVKGVNPTLADASAVASATVNGPGMIIVN